MKALFIFSAIILSFIFACSNGPADTQIDTPVPTPAQRAATSISSSSVATLSPMPKTASPSPSPSAQQISPANRPTIDARDDAGAVFGVIVGDTAELTSPLLLYHLQTTVGVGEGVKELNLILNADTTKIYAVGMQHRDADNPAAPVVIVDTFNQYTFHLMKPDGQAFTNSELEFLDTVGPQETPVAPPTAAASTESPPPTATVVVPEDAQHQEVIRFDVTERGPRGTDLFHNGANATAMGGLEERYGETLREANEIWKVSSDPGVSKKPVDEMFTFTLHAEAGDTIENIEIDNQDRGATIYATSGRTGRSFVLRVDATLFVAIVDERGTTTTYAFTDAARAAMNASPLDSNLEGRTLQEIDLAELLRIAVGPTSKVPSSRDVSAVVIAKERVAQKMHKVT